MTPRARRTLPLPRSAFTRGAAILAIALSCAIPSSETRAAGPPEISGRRADAGNPPFADEKATATAAAASLEDEAFTDEERRAEENERKRLAALAAEYDSVAAAEPRRPYGDDGSSDRPRERTFTEAFIQMVLYLGAICLLAYLVLGKLLPRMLKIEPPSAQQRALHVVDRLQLDQRRSILVLKLADLYFLIGVSDHGVALLSRLESEDVKEALARGEVSKPMQGRLAGILARRSEKGR